MKQKISFFLFCAFISYSIQIIKAQEFSVRFHNNNEYILKHETLEYSRVQPINYEHVPLETSDGIGFDAYHVKNNSDTVIVFGHGFQNTCEDIKSIAELFNPDYDLVIFDYRWAHYLKRYAISWENLKSPTKALLTCEKDEIKTVVDYVRSLNKYKKVIGLGQCYSAMTFIIAQEDAVINNYLLFDKIICDSSPSSVSDLFKSVMNDPMLPFNSKKGGFPSLIRKLFITDKLIDVCEAGFKLTNTHFPLDNALQTIAATPILFFHGRKDKLVSLDNFEKIWKAKQGAKIACLTPFYHVEHKNHPGVYTTVSKAFIESSKFEIPPQAIAKLGNLTSCSIQELLSPHLEKPESIPSRKRGNFLKRIRKKIRKHWCK